MKNKDNTIEGGKYDKGTLEMNDGTTQCCGKCGCKRDWKRTAIIWTGVVLVILIGKLVGC